MEAYGWDLNGQNGLVDMQWLETGEVWATLVIKVIDGIR